jgi:GNAT superfamily N-acetyltransferase
MNIRRLEPGDAPILAVLAREDADFGLDDGEPTPPLPDADAAAYLADPAVLHWIAERDGAVLGHLLAIAIRKRQGEPRELLLYDIGVRAAHRRTGVGRALMEAMGRWMGANDVGEVWVLADAPGAVDFYRACGFELPGDAPTYMTAGRIRIRTGL